MEPIQGLDAITVHIRDPDQARDFYTRVLGFKELSFDAAAQRGTWQIPGGATLVAHVQRPDEPGRPAGTVTGVMFHVRDAQASRDEIARRGGKVDEPWKAPWGPTYVTVWDPDGNEWLLIQR
ncbi:MAG: VOC family protein [Halobacteriales archaeon]|nr:VOC family protein [Halobacteriales archaeon]